MPAQSSALYTNTRNDSAFRFLGFPTLVRAGAENTGGAFGLVESWEMPPGFASPYHVHHLEDEAFYVLEGTLAVICGGKWLTAGPGDYVFGPREVPHGFKVVGNVPARMLLLCSPAGFENFVRELRQPLEAPPAPPDMAKLATVAAKFKIDILGPLPEQPGESAEAALGLDGKSMNLRWIHAFNQRDWQAEKSCRSRDFRAHMSGAKEPLNSDAWMGFMSAFTTAFPDGRISVDSCIAEGDTVATRWTLTGTHRGEFQGVPPTGKAVTITGIDFSRVADGKFTRHWAQFDLMSLMQQIGAMPA